MLTTQEWKQVETELSFMLGRVTLQADGYKVDARVVQLNSLRLGIQVFVNGQRLGAWIEGNAEEPRKFWFECKRFLYSKAKRDAAAKQARRRGLDPWWKAHLQQIATGTYSLWTPVWGSPRSFTRHLRKNCKQIVLVSAGFNDEA